MLVLGYVDVKVFFGEFLAPPTQKWSWALGVVMVVDLSVGSQWPCMRVFSNVCSMSVFGEVCSPKVPVCLHSFALAPVKRKRAAPVAILSSRLDKLLF